MLEWALAICTMAQMHYAPTPDLMDRLRAAVRKHGLNRVAAHLGIHRLTLATVLAGGGRQGSIALVALRASEQPELMA